MVDITEILVHWHAGRSKSEIAASLGVDRKTISNYVAPAIAAGIRPGGPPISEARWARLVAEWFPELSDTRLRQVTWLAIAAHHEFITGQLRAGVTMATIHQRLVDEHGLAVSVASLRRYVAANLPEEVRRSQVTVLAPHAARPGQAAQLDYGKLGMWTDPATGRRHAVWAFAMGLCCSRHMFVRPVIKLDQRSWTESHVAAFEFFGGVPARLVPDNLKTGVDKPDRYDPKLNRSYAELAAHYGFLVDPARARKPKDKPRIERPMPYIRGLVLAGPGVHVAGADAGRGGALVPAGSQGPFLPAAGWGGATGGVRVDRERHAQTAAGDAVRAGDLDESGRPGRQARRADAARQRGLCLPGKRGGQGRRAGVLWGPRSVDGIPSAVIPKTGEPQPPRPAPPHHPT